MLNASGKAKLFYRRDNGNLSGIHYHAADRPAAIEGFRSLAPARSTLLLFLNRGAKADVYAVTPGDPANITYVSKYVGSILDYTVWDGASVNGVAFGGGLSPNEAARMLGELVHNDPTAYRAQEIRD